MVGGCLVRSSSSLQPACGDLDRHVLWYLFSPSSVTTYVMEWFSPDFHNPRLHWFELFLPISAAAGLWSACRQQFGWSVLSLGGLHLALAAARNIPVCAVLCAAPIASLIEGFLEEHGLPLCPESAGRKKLLFTTDAWADYLIYANSGRQVFLEGRNDLYGPDLVRAYVTVVEALPGWQEVLRTHRVSVMLVPLNSAIGAALASSGEWRLSYRDDTAAIFEGRESFAPR